MIKSYDERTFEVTKSKTISLMKAAYVKLERVVGKIMKLEDF